MLTATLLLPLALGGSAEIRGPVPFAVPPAALERQQAGRPPDDPTVLGPVAEPHPVRVQLMSLAGMLRAIAGQYVRVQRVHVAKVISPHAFTIQAPGGGAFGDARALVVTPRPVALEAGTELEVVGHAYTWRGARAQPEWPSSLSGLEGYEDDPVVIAEGLQTPGGVSLYGALP